MSVRLNKLLELMLDGNPALSTHMLQTHNALASRQALGTPFSEQLTLGPPGGAHLDISAAAEATATAAAPPKQPVRSLRLRGFGALAALDVAALQPATQRQRQGEAAEAPAAAADSAKIGKAAGAVAPAERPGLVLLPGSLAGDGSRSPTDGGTGGHSGGSDNSGAFRAVLCSSYLASLPAGRDDSSDGGRDDGSGGSRAISRVEGGLSIAYSLAAGETAATLQQFCSIMFIDSSAEDIMITLPLTCCKGGTSNHFGG